MITKTEQEKISIVDFEFDILQLKALSTCNMDCEFSPYPIRPDKGIIWKKIVTN